MPRLPPEGDRAVTAVLDALRRIVRVLRLSSRRAERELGVSGAQLFVLQRLAEGPARSVNDLARRTYTHQSSVSVVVRRLSERGLVVRRRSTQDARRVELTLSPAGRALLRRAPLAAQARLVRALCAAPAPHRARLALMLRRLVAQMGAADEPATLLFEDERH